MYANVLVEIGAKQVDKMFTYLIHDNLINDVKVGIRVKVPFGKLTLEGFVMEIVNKYTGEFELREIIEVIDKEPILNEEMLELGKKIQEMTLCSLISAYQVMLPKSLKAKNNTKRTIKKTKYLVLNKSEEEIKNYLLTTKSHLQRVLLEELLKEKEKRIERKSSVINTLLEKNLIKIEEKETYRYNYEVKNNYKEIILNSEQENCLNEILAMKNQSRTFLIHGVTGSGKTEVYIRLIEDIIKSGKTAIMLVPEISLTPQIVDRFVARFGNNVAILHSGLSDAERYDEYRKIVKEEVKIVIGARSAIFAPLKNIGIIIIDEEHVSSYKQENNPKYHAIEVAKLRSLYHKAPLVLGSATPSLESYARAKKNVYTLIELKKRANKQMLPKTHLVDMGIEIKKNKNFIFSKLLIEKIKERLENKEQIILLLNRRGYSSMISCPNCGYVHKCPHCDISLTYHKTSDMLRCHYCGYGTKRNQRCPSCNSENLKDLGLGTEKLEEELKKIFKTARIVRMDLDTTSRKGAHQKIIDGVNDYQYDILLGTQMIAKGLDFPLVTLVGVINADTSLNIPDFRSAENNFQLLCQVAGRSGRSEKVGEVIIQTFNTDHYSIICAKNHDYATFYQVEMSLRRKLKYSPYYYLTLIKISSSKFEEGYKEAGKISSYLKNNLTNSIILGPTTCNVLKIKNTYYFQCIIKYKEEKNLFKILKNIDEQYKFNNKINVEIDTSPIKL